MILKLVVDFTMTIALLFLVTYELIGEKNHELIGAIMFVLFILHHILNVKWSKNLLKGKYTAFRILQTLLVFLLTLTMLGSIVGGIILSKHVFVFLPISSGRDFARILHMLCAYWGFVLMSLHLGLHWNMIVSVVSRLMKKSSNIQKWGLRSIAVLIAVYGMYAFVKREIGLYMTLNSMFVFFDFGEPLIFFFADNISVMGLFVFMGHYCAVLLKKSRSKE